MKFLSHSGNAPQEVRGVPYESTVTLRSKVREGVEFAIVRMSFARRMALARAVLELSRRFEFKKAGESLEDQVEAGIISGEIDQLYLGWGLVSITGLILDGVNATPALLIEKGPDDLAKEIVAAVKAQCGLSDSERKN